MSNAVLAQIKHDLAVSEAKLETEFGARVAALDLKYPKTFAKSLPMRDLESFMTVAESGMELIC